MFAAVCYGLVAVFCLGVMEACSHRASGSSYRDDEDNYFSEEDNNSNQYMQKRDEPIKWPPPNNDEYFGKDWPPPSNDEYFEKLRDEAFGKKKDE